MEMDTTTMQDDRCSGPVKHNLLYQVYLHLEAKRPMERVLIRGKHLLALTAELDEAVCDEKPRAEVREYISAIEYIAEEIRTICIRYELERRK